MKKSEFIQICQAGLILLDGATGTNLQAAGMPSGVSPEAWVLDNRTVLTTLQQAFYEAGSDMVYAFSFGANRIKLAQHGLPSDSKSVVKINHQLAAISCELRDQMAKAFPDRRFYVAGDLSPTGTFLKPAGEMDFEELIAIYKEQVAGLIAANVDLFVVETMLDLAQTRAAVFAIRSLSDYPIMASLTVEANQRTLSGDTIRSALLALSALDVQAVGLNCSFGPDQMSEILTGLPQVDDCFLLAKPNAGMPRLDTDGRTCFDMEPQSFANAMIRMLPLGVRVMGGCCGTTPAHLTALSACLADQAVTQSTRRSTNDAYVAKTGSVLSEELLNAAIVCSARSDQTLAHWRQWTTLVCSHLDDLIDDYMDSLEEHPEGLCIDFTSLASFNRNALADAMAELQMISAVPVIFCCENTELQYLLARYWHGRTAFVTGQHADLPHSYYLRP